MPIPDNKHSKKTNDQGLPNRFTKVCYCRKCEGPIFYTNIEAHEFIESRKFVFFATLERIPKGSKPKCPFCGIITFPQSSMTDRLNEPVLDIQNRVSHLIELQQHKIS